MTNTKVTVRLHLATSIDVLCFKSVLLYLDTQKTSFNYPTIQEYHFLTLRYKNCKSFQLSYSKSGIWLSHISQLVTLYTRTAKAILNHTPIKKYQIIIFSCRVYLISIQQLPDCSKFVHSLLIDLSLLIKDFVNFLKEYSSVFAFLLKNNLLLLSFHKCSNSLLFCFYK